MTITITFRPPPRKQCSSSTGVQSSSVHKRHLESIPKRVAQRVGKDFVRYRLRRKYVPSAKQRKIYRFEHGGDEVQIALDFGEVIALHISGDDEAPTDASGSEAADRMRLLSPRSSFAGPPPSAKKRSE